MSTGPTVQVDKTYATVEIASGGATVTVDVPETTVSITAPGPQGPAGTGADGYILQAYDTTDQTAASTTTAYPIRLGTVDISDGITVANNGSSQPTQITFANDGDYNVQFSIQFVNTSATEANANVWFRKNETDISNSNSQITVPKKHGSDNGAIIMALNFIVSAAAGDYVEIMWQTESTTVSIEQLPAGTTPTTPATPSVIVTAMVNRYLEVGPAGPGVATGGTTGQVLTKASATNYDTTWATPSLNLIKTVSVGSGVANVQVTDAFSSAYRNYLIVIDSLRGSAAADLNMTVGSTTSGYYIYGYYNVSGSAGPISGANIGYWFCGQSPSAASGRAQGATIRIFAPNVATQTAIEGTSYGNRYWASFGGSAENTTQYTSFTLTPSTGTYSSGQVSVYGYNA